MNKSKTDPISKISVVQLAMTTVSIQLKDNVSGSVPTVHTAAFTTYTSTICTRHKIQVVAKCTARMRTYTFIGVLFLF